MLAADLCWMPLRRLPAAATRSAAALRPATASAPPRPCTADEADASLLGALGARKRCACVLLVCGPCTCEPDEPGATKAKLPTEAAPRRLPATRLEERDMPPYEQVTGGPRRF